MAVFISYSHQDAEFVESLAHNLMVRKTHVWFDRWEIKVGDSLLTKVQAALQSASALLVVLSQASVESEWCKREVNAALTRELEERKVLLLPLRLDSCEVPLFLRDKKYADFRSNFDQGLRDVLDGIAAVTSENLGTIEDRRFHTDWNIAWRISSNELGLEILLAEHADGHPSTVITQVIVSANESAARWHDQCEREGLGWWARKGLLVGIERAARGSELRFLLEDESIYRADLEASNEKVKHEIRIHIESRRLGADNGNNLSVDVGAQLAQVCKASHERIRQPTPAEKNRIAELAQLQATRA